MAEVQNVARHEARTELQGAEVTEAPRRPQAVKAILHAPFSRSESGRVGINRRQALMIVAGIPRNVALARHGRMRTRSDSGAWEREPPATETRS